MAHNQLALADLLKINDVSIRDMGATDIFLEVPLIAALIAIKASHGTQHKYNKWSGAPTVGFRAAGDGRDHSKSTDTTVTKDLKILDASISVEAALANSNPKGRDYVINRESERSLAQALKNGEKQILYGTDAAGFGGLAQETHLDGTADAMVVNAGTASAGNAMDVWMIRTTPDEANVCIVVGNDGEIKIGDYYEQMMPGANSKDRNCYVQPIEAWMGLIVGGLQSVGRIVNIDGRSTATANTVTDNLLSDLFERFPEEAPPTHIVMNKRARKQLQQSRTATRADGADAPWPTSWEGIPILSTSSIPTTGTIVA